MNHVIFSAQGLQGCKWTNSGLGFLFRGLTLYPVTKSAFYLKLGKVIPYKNPVIQKL